MVCCSANPASCDGTDAAASVSPDFTHVAPPIFSPNLTATAARLEIAPKVNVTFERREPPAAPPAVSPAARQTSRHARGYCVPMRAEPMKLSRSESGDPVCRPIRLSLSSFRFSACLRRRPLGAKLLRAMLRAFRAARRPSYRADSVNGKLVGSGRHSKCFFAGVQCSRLMPVYRNFLATRARGTPLRSDRGGDGASPAPCNNAATGSAWPVPSSTTAMPPGASNAGALAAIAR
jgi:hypothetical protein